MDDKPFPVFPMVMVGVLIAGLCLWLWWLRRDARAEARERRRIIRDRPEPVPVDRAYDHRLCTYCDDEMRTGCSACSRPLCGLHAPWLEHLFCYACEREWAEGAWRRAFVIVPALILCMGAVAIAAGLVILALEHFVGLSVGRALIGAVIVAGGGLVPLYFQLERRLRRRFVSKGALPHACMHNCLHRS